MPSWAKQDALWREAMFLPISTYALFRKMPLKELLVECELPVFKISWFTGGATTRRLEKYRE
jgi:hypothetical protein